MSLKVANRVKESTLTSGNGTIALAGAMNGYQSFSSVLSSGDTTYYTIINGDSWEVGIGTYSSNILSRDVVLSSSNSNNKLDLNGQSYVFIAYPSEKSVYKDQNDQVVAGSSGIIIGSGNPFNTSNVLYNSSGILYFNGLPVGTTVSITGVSGIGVSQNGNSYTISATGSFGLTSGQIQQLLNSGVSINVTSGTGNFNSLSIGGIPVSVSGHTHLSSSITDFNSSVSGLLTPYALLNSGNFITLRVNGVPVSLSGHVHTSSQITDFNSSVSGLLPSVSGSGYVQSVFSDNRYIISVNGLQPSGNYSLVGHSHLVSDISNFGSGVSGLIPVKDILAGSGIQIGVTSGIYTVTAYGVAASSASSLITRCENRTGSTLPKMTVVYINGGHGNRPTIQKSIASSEGGSSKTYGITASQINNNSAGDVVVFGELIDVNTDQFGAVEGSTLYLSPSVSGNLTTIKPTAPNHMVVVGKIVRNHVNQGIIEVSIQNGFELEELHNVATTGAISGQFLKYDGSLWRNSGITSSDIGNFNSSVSGLLTPYAQLNDATFNTLNVDTLFTCNTTNFSIDGDGNTSIGNNSQLVDVSMPNLSVVYELSFASGTASSGLNVFNYLRLNNTGVSLSGHTHLVSDISNFGSGVSGLLPVKEILPGNNVTITSNSGIYTINASGGGGGSSVSISDPGSGRVLVSDGTSSGIIGQSGLTFSNNSLFINGVNVNNGKNLFLWSTYR
jgi:hypothetical protein